MSYVLEPEYTNGPDRILRDERNPHQLHKPLSQEEQLLTAYYYRKETLLYQTGNFQCMNGA
jgi:hypothetical protein